MNYIISFTFPEDYRTLYKSLRMYEREELRNKVRELVDEYLQSKTQNVEKHEMDKIIDLTKVRSEKLKQKMIKSIVDEYLQSKKQVEKHEMDEILERQSA